MTTSSATCTACGAPLAPSARFCRSCGQPALAADATLVLPEDARPRTPAAAGGGQPAATQPPDAPRPPYPPVHQQRGRGRLVALGALGALLLTGVGAGVLFLRTRGGEGDAGRASAPAPVRTVAAEPTPVVTATLVPTPAPSPAAPTATPAPTPSPTPTPREENGLLIIDETWSGRVVEPGGLRIRSSPRVEPNNVVGSVAAGTTVTVEGRALNGGEAEVGKGTVWLIVGPRQYIYGAPGYVERIR